MASASSNDSPLRSGGSIDAYISSPPDDDVVAAVAARAGSLEGNRRARLEEEEEELLSVGGRVDRPPAAADDAPLAALVAGEGVSAEEAGAAAASVEGTALSGAGVVEEIVEAGEDSSVEDRGKSGVATGVVDSASDKLGEGIAKCVPPAVVEGVEGNGVPGVEDAGDEVSDLAFRRSACASRGDRPITNPSSGPRRVPATKNPSSPPTFRLVPLRKADFFSSPDEEEAAAAPAKEEEAAAFEVVFGPVG